MAAHDLWKAMCQVVGQCGTNADDAGAPCAPRGRARRGRAGRARRDGPGHAAGPGRAAQRLSAPSRPARRSGSPCASASPRAGTPTGRTPATPASRHGSSGRCPAGSRPARSQWPHPERIRRGPGDELRLLGRGRAADRDHGAGRPGAGHARHAARPGELGRLREDVHPGGGAGRARPCPSPPARPRRTRAARPGSPPRAGRCRPRARGRRRSLPRPSTVTLTVAAPGLTPDASRRGVVLSRALGRDRARRPSAGRAPPPTGLTLAMARGPLPEAVAGPIEGVLVVTERLDGGCSAHGAGRARGAAGGRSARPRSLLVGDGAGAGRRPRAEPDAVRAARCSR